jgi:hypothetical protein
MWSRIDEFMIILALYADFPDLKSVEAKLLVADQKSKIDFKRLTAYNRVLTNLDG